MEWRRTYPELVIKILGGIFILSVLMIPLALMGGFIPFMISVFGICSVMGVGIAVFITRAVSRNEILYRTTVNFDTEDLIELIRKGDEDITRIMRTKFKKNRMEVWFSHQRYFVYRYQKGVIEIPRAAMKQQKKSEFSYENLEGLVEDIVKKNRGKIHGRPQNIDLASIKKEIDLLKSREVKRQMGTNKQPYIYNPTTKYLNYTVFIFLIVGSIVTTPIVAVTAKEEVLLSTLMGAFFGGLGGVLLWLVVSFIVTRIVGDHAQPTKYRLAARNLDTTNWGETKRTSIPYRDISEVKRLWNSDLISIKVEGFHVIGSGIISFLPNKILLKMDDNEYEKLRTRTKKR